MVMGVDSAMGLVGKLMMECCVVESRFGCVFVGAFSDFGDLRYRIPAPISGLFC
jgi:hypothetical protein